LSRSATSASWRMAAAEGLKLSKSLLPVSSAPAILNTRQRNAIERKCPSCGIGTLCFLAHAPAALLGSPMPPSPELVDSSWKDRSLPMTNVDLESTPGNAARGVFTARKNQTRSPPRDVLEGFFRTCCFTVTRSQPNAFPSATKQYLSIPVNNGPAPLKRR
jgi:hypothetical protein